MAISCSTTERSVSQNNSGRPSSRRTSTAACSELPQRCCTVPLMPENWLFQWPSLTLTTVPLRASLACTSFSLLLFLLPRCPSLEYHRPSLSRRGLILHRSLLVVPVKLDVSEAHVHRHVVGVAVGSYRSADAPFPRPLPRPTRRHAPHGISRRPPPSVCHLGPDPTHRRVRGIRSRALSRSCCISGHYTFLCTRRHFVLKSTWGGNCRLIAREIRNP